MANRHALITMLFLLASSPAFADGPVGTDLMGTSWTLTQLNGAPAATGVTTTLNISADGIGGNGGCNTYGGSLAFPDGKLDISQVMSTMMACEEPKMGQEQAFFRVLEAATAYSVDEGTLSLEDNNGTALAVFTAQ